MTNDELRPAGWYPDPAGQPRQKYWDGQTWQATAQPTIPAVPKSKTWKKRLGIAAAVVLALVLGVEAGDSHLANWGGGTDPEDGMDSEDGTDSG
jgi:Protein of unknown function (DUF2510)